MGFDIHGVNPVERVFEEEKYPTFNKYNDMEWNERQKLFNKDEELQTQFYNEMTARENENPGIYFRNNVWWWRPLWNYVCGSCEDILDSEDMEEGQSNSGHLITEEKASAVAKKLFELIEEGDTKGYEDFHRKQADEADADNERYLADGGKKYGDGWNWADSYPFNVDNVRNFATFCAESGGFEIC